MRLLSLPPVPECPAGFSTAPEDEVQERQGAQPSDQPERRLDQQGVSDGVTLAEVMTAHPLAAVELRGLTKQFGSVLANAGVNLRVEAARFMA